MTVLEEAFTMWAKGDDEVIAQDNKRNFRESLTQVLNGNFSLAPNPFQVLYPTSEDLFREMGIKIPSMTCKSDLIQLDNEFQFNEPTCPNSHSRVETIVKGMMNDDNYDMIGQPEMRRFLGGSKLRVRLGPSYRNGTEVKKSLLHFPESDFVPEFDMTFTMHEAINSGPEGYSSRIFIGVEGESQISSGPKFREFDSENLTKLRGITKRINEIDGDESFILAKKIVDEMNKGIDNENYKWSYNSDSGTWYREIDRFPARLILTSLGGVGGGYFGSHLQGGIGPMLLGGFLGGLVPFALGHYLALNSRRKQVSKVLEGLGIEGNPHNTLVTARELYGERRKLQHILKETNPFHDEVKVGEDAIQGAYEYFVTHKPNPN